MTPYLYGLLFMPPQLRDLEFPLLKNVEEIVRKVDIGLVDLIDEERPRSPCWKQRCA